MDESRPVGASFQKSRPSSWRLTTIIISVLLIGALGWQTWQVKQAQSQLAADQNSIVQLQSKVDDLTRQLAAAKKTTSPLPSSQASSSGTTPTTPAPTVPSQATKDSIMSAVKNKDYASLQTAMASSVDVVVAASGKTGYESPAQAVSDLSYLDRGTQPWGFTVPAATLGAWQAGFYKNYFVGTVYVGEATNKVVVSFGFDSAGKIKLIFMAASADLLM